MNNAHGASADPVERGYHALRTTALQVDFSHRSRGLFHGPRAGEVLNGLVSNEVAALVPGHGTYAVALTPKGKIIADLRIFRREDDVLVDVAASAGAGWWSMVRKYVNPRLSRHEDISAATRALGIFGPAAEGILEKLGGVPLGDLPRYGHRAVMMAEAAVTIARVPDAGVPGFMVYMPEASRDGVAAAWLAAGALPGEIASFDIARVESGRPEWGIDMDDTTLTQEAGMDDLGAISYTKGCYTGQETVARVHFRGHVNRLLRGVTFVDGAVVPRATPLRRDDGTVCGEVRSVVLSPRAGRIGLAMVRREVEPGASLFAHAEGAESGVPVIVTALPFGSDGHAA
ncbi:MAG: aminomethyl transferase family protein [Cytophagaceae bacterium]|nr:aminomethyl transferase family protein [Gemmatimonadaceae bacterium]